jgi:hypothetical protein
MDSDLVIIVGGARIPPGRIGEDHDYGALADYITRRKAEVQEDWDHMVGQLTAMAKKLAATTGKFSVQEVEFQLGFSAKGKLGFIAEAGATGSVKVKFVRSAVANGGQP